MIRQKIHLVKVYAPYISKSRKEIVSFYETLETEVSNMPSNIKLLGSLNVRVLMLGMRHSLELNVITMNTISMKIENP